MSKRNTLKRKRGFALAETVIALTVVLMVSAAALTMIMSSILVKTTSIIETEARGFASDALECFKVSDDHDAFKENLEFAVGKPLTDRNDADPNAYQYVFDGFVANIKVNDDLTEFEIQLVNKNEEILAFTYRKGGGGT